MYTIKKFQLKRRLSQIINFPQKLVEYCWHTMEKKVLEFEPHLTDLGVFVIVAFPCFYFINVFLIGLEGYENLALRISIGVLGLLLILRDKLPEVKVLMPILLYGTVVYAFIFFFFFMLFNNPLSPIWQINTLIGLFFFAFFVDWKEYIILNALGILLAWLAFSWGDSQAKLPPNFYPLLLTYACPAVYLAVFSNKKDDLQQTRLHHMKLLAASLAHELRTPLSAVSMGAQSLGELLPIYQRTYAQAKEAQLVVEPLSARQEQSLAELPEDLLTIANNAHTVINMLLMNLKEDPHYPLVTCSMNHCVDEALKSYPFSPPERLRMHWHKGDDFTFKGHTELMKHVLFNLIKNALYATAGKGEIFIHLETGSKTHRLVFKDTGKGIAPQDLPHVFDRFYTRTQHGTGIGLAFCYDVLNRLGGSITCTSVEREHTTFTLHLPAMS